MFSIVLPVFNREKSIMNAVNSVLGQTYSSWELIIIDDRSTDNTAKVLSGIKDPRVKVILLKNNKGAAGARNAGLRIARGEFISFLDSDDYYEADFLKESLKTLHGTPENIGFMWTGTRFHSASSFKENPAWVPIRRSTPYETLLHSLHIGTNTGITLKAEVLKVCGFFNEELPAAEDTEFFLRISKSFDYTYNEKVLINIFRADDDRLSKDLVKIAIAYNRFLPEHFEKINQNIRLKRKFYYKLMWLNYNLSDKKKARFYFSLIPKGNHKKRWRYFSVFILYEFLPLGLAKKIHRRFSF